MIPALLAAIAVLSYLLGSIDAARIVTRFVYHRRGRLGYGVKGMTRLYRSFGWQGLAMVQGIDAVKTILAVLLGGAILNAAGVDPADTTVSYVAIGRLFAAFCVLLGHCYPAFRRFRGGRGGVVALVALFCVNPAIGFFTLLIAGALGWFTRYVPLTILAGALFAPLAVWVEYGALGARVTFLAALLLLLRHRAGILRLVQRKEQKVEFKQDLSTKFETEDF